MEASNSSNDGPRRSKQRGASFVGLPSLSSARQLGRDAAQPQQEQDLHTPQPQQGQEQEQEQQQPQRYYTTINSNGEYTRYAWAALAPEPAQADVENNDRTSLLLEYTKRQLGKERLRSSIRQLGGMILALGIGAAYSAFALIAYLLEGRAGYDQIRGFRLPLLVGTMLQVLCGLVSMATGVVCLIYAPTSSRRFHKWSRYFVIIVNLGPISFVITVSRLIMGAREPPEKNDFIPPEMNPTQGDIIFAAMMGIAVLVSVCATLIGGLTVLGLHLMALLAGQPHSRGRRYHVIRYGYYSLLVMIGGVAQLALGSYLIQRFGAGPYEKAVHVAAFTIYFPCISVLVGTLQTLMGMYGWARAVGWCKMVLTDKLGDEERMEDENGVANPESRRDHGFQYLVLFTWVVTVYLQFMFQPAYGVADSFDAEGATTAAVYIGFFVMVAYLDWLVRVTPVHVNACYYGIDTNKVKPFKEDFLVKIFYRKQLAEEAAIEAAPRVKLSIGSEDSFEEHFSTKQRKQSMVRFSSGTNTARTSSMASNDIPLVVS